MTFQKKNIVLNAIAAALYFGFITIAWGHHSTVGRFATDESIELHGQVTNISWRNPHSLISIEVTENGETNTWEVEVIGMTALRRSGLDLDQLKVGDEVIVGGPASLLDKTETFLRYLVIERDSEQISFMGNPPGTPEESAGPALTGVIPFMENGDASEPELGLFRVWVTAGFVPLYPDSENSFALTEEGQSLSAAFDPVTDNPTLNCNPKGMPLIMEQPYPMQFTDRGEDILFELEEYDTKRIIHMNQSQVPAGIQASLLGYSRGHWDGRTLVVTTSNIDWPWLSQRGIPLSSEVLVIERFNPVDDGSRLDYKLTILDPVMFKETLELSKHWVYLPDLQVESYNCQ